LLNKSVSKVIAIIEPIGDHAGLDIYNIGLSEAIASNGVHVRLYTNYQTVIEKKLNLKTDIKKYYKDIYNNNSNYLIRGIRFIIASLKTVVDAKINNVCLAHFHIFNFSLLELFNLILFKIIRFKVVATIHDIDKLSTTNSKHSKVRFFIFEKIIEEVLVHTEHTKKELNKYFINTQIEDIKIVPHGDMDFIYNVDILKEEARAQIKINLEEDEYLILFFGQVKKVKGIDILLKSFAKVIKHQKVKLLIAGKLWKNDSMEYHTIVKDNNLNDKVIFRLAFIPAKDVPLYFKSADIVVLPYKKVYNSGVLLRAMDYGSTLIVSDLAPLVNIIKHGETGLVFESENVNSLSQSIEDLLNNKILREDLKYNAKRYLDENYSWDYIGKKTLDAYNLEI